LVDRAVIEQIGVGVEAVDFQDFGHEPAARPALEVNDHVERISDVCLNCAKAKVSPATTIATSDSPRAMVLVKAVSRTLTAFSHGELPAWAKAGAAKRRVRPIATTKLRSHDGTKNL
jgi:hypothetical protein